MTVYMIAERGANYPLKMGSIRFCDDLSAFFRQHHIDYINVCERFSKMDRKYTGNFGTFLQDRRAFVFECKPGKINRQNGKPQRPKNLIKGKEVIELAQSYGFDTEV
jgi:hypothetical protein